MGRIPKKASWEKPSKVPLRHPNESVEMLKKQKKWDSVTGGYDTVYNIRMRNQARNRKK